MTNKESEKYLISVAPLSTIPLGRDQSFFYTYTEKIPLGSLVEIPIGRRKTQGIVTAAHSDFQRASGITLKSVSEITYSNFLSREQLQLAEHVAHHYITPLGPVLKLMIPKKATAKKAAKTTPLPETPPATLNKNDTDTCDKILVNISDDRVSETYLQTTYAPHAYDALTYIVRKTLEKTSGQILILVPERTHISILANELLGTFPKDILTTLSSSLTGGAFYENWEKIRGGKSPESPHIVIGTRSAAFAPFAKLSAVIVMQPRSTSHKQWEGNPRYDARFCAKKLSHIHTCALLHIGATPPYASLEFTEKSKHTLSVKKPYIDLVDMKIEYNDVNEKKYKKSHPILSRSLVGEISSALSKKSQSLLFINRGGKNAFSVCEQCATVARCPQCERALVEKSSGNHKCLHCSYKTAIFPRCTNCKSLHFKTVGLGTEAVEELVKKKFPHARIMRIDSDSMQKRTAFESAWKKIVSGKVDIIIGTQMALPQWSLPKLSLAAIIDMDTLLEGYEYDTHEKAYAHIQEIGSCLSLSGALSKKLLIQSYDVEHEVLRSALQKDPLKSWEEFASDDLAMRKILHFPPYAHIIKLLHAHPNKNLQEKEVTQTYEKIIEKCGNLESLIISEPHDPLLSKIRTKHRKQIIIKNKDPEKLATPLHDILIGLNKNWTRDIDPVNLA